jgi:hypothetical protein
MLPAAGSATDRAGNIYMTLTQRDNSSCAVVVQLAAGSNRVVQLFTIETESETRDDEPWALAVAPDGQSMFVGLRDGRILRIKAPFKGASPVAFGRLQTGVTELIVDDTT